MDKREFARQAETLLGKLRWSDSVPVGLCDVSQRCWENKWKTPDDVPEGEREKVLLMLYKEVQIREIMGRSAYFGSLSLLGKAATYEAAAQAIAERAHEAGTENVRMSWTEFREMLSGEIKRGCTPSED